MARASKPQRRGPSRNAPESSLPRVSWDGATIRLASSSTRPSSGTSSQSWACCRCRPSILGALWRCWSPSEEKSPQPRADCVATLKQCSTPRRRGENPAAWRGHLDQLLPARVPRNEAGPAPIGHGRADCLPKYIELWPRAERVGAQGEWWTTVALSTFNSLAAAVAAFVLGNLVRWVWW